MKAIETALRRPLAFTAALALAVIGILPALSFSSVSAASQVTGRSMTLSDSTASAVNVTYAMTFTLPDAAQSLVVDFCAESPIIGGTCTTPTGFTAAGGDFHATYTPTGSLPIPGGGAGAQPSGWSKDTFTAGTLKINGSALTAGTKYTFYFTGITNPSTSNASGSNPFYARVYTYANNSYGATAYSGPTSPGSYADYGGFALSTANNVTITAVVMETLGFCVSKLAPSAGCGSVAGTGQQAVTTPALTLGHGTPLALDTSRVDTDTAYTQLSTNAYNGAVVALKTTSSTTCSGLSRDNGATCPIPAHSDTTAPITAGTANFGLLVGPGAIAPLSTYTGAGIVTPTTGTYAGNGTGTATTGNYYMGTTAPVNTFGDVIEASTSACQDSNNQLTYGATVSATTPAGVYTTTEALIATGTF